MRDGMTGAQLKLPVYLDNQATTPVDPRVLEAMLPYLREKFGNAASTSHRFGWIAEEAVDKSREQVAKLIGASPSEVVFTSGATESNNLALKGAAHAYGMTRAEKALLDALARLPPEEAEAIAPKRFGPLDWADVARRGAREVFAARGDHLITVQSEHKSVLDVMKRLELEGYRVTYLPVEKSGLVDLRLLSAAIEPGTILVSIMAANNEIGVLQPIAEIGALLKEKRVLFHSDGAQALGKVPVDVNAMQVDLLSLSAHKLHGPKGIGALYVRRKAPRVTLEPLNDGGGHEKGLRSGTLDVPAIVGFGAAAEIASAEMEGEGARLLRLRTKLLEGIRAGLDGVEVNGDLERRLPGNLHLSFGYVEGEALMTAMKDVAVSSGSACTSALREPSHVLRAIGTGDDRAHSSLRFGLGRFTTEAEIDFVVRQVIEKVKKLREISPLYEAAR
jgi:cysteine desulfurase